MLYSLIGAVLAVVGYFAENSWLASVGGGVCVLGLVRLLRAVRLSRDPDRAADDDASLQDEYPFFSACGCVGEDMKARVSEMGSVKKLPGSYSAWQLFAVYGRLRHKTGIPFSRSLLRPAQSSFRWRPYPACRCADTGGSRRLRPGASSSCPPAQFWRRSHPRSRLRSPSGPSGR